MASLEKYTDNAVLYELRHNTRENPRPPKNIDIDKTRSKDNYFLSPEDHGRTARESKSYHKRRLSEVYHYNRADVKTACQWVVTAPADLPAGQEDIFFRETYDYLNSLYGEENCLQAVVHKDEGVKDKNGAVIAGRAHMHYVFIPVVENKKYMKPNKKGNITRSSLYKEKVCADQLINKAHLKRFHTDYQKWLNGHGVRCTVQSGITGGKNRSVEELKAETRQLLLAKEKILQLEAEKGELLTKVHELEAELSLEHDNGTSSWGASSGWGKGKDRSWDMEI